MKILEMVIETSNYDPDDFGLFEHRDKVLCVSNIEY